MQQPYRILAPCLRDWLPSASESLHLPVIFGVLYAVGASALILAWGAAWVWLFLGMAIILHVLMWVVVNHGLREQVGGTRLVAMQRRCAARSPHGGCETAGEKALDQAFREAGILVHHQQLVPSGFRPGYEYRTDFAYFDPSCGLRIDIEVDGNWKEGDEDVQRRMARRDRWFVGHGWHVIRFWSPQCYSSPSACVAWVRDYVARARQEHRQALHGTFGDGWDDRDGKPRRLGAGRVGVLTCICGAALLLFSWLVAGVFQPSGVSGTTQPTKAVAQIPKCPRCGAEMVVRTNSKTRERFYGCSRFPACRGSRNFP